MNSASINTLIYTDASYDHKHKVAACGYVILRDGKMIKHEVLLIDNVANTRDAELYAICQALKIAMPFASWTKNIIVNTDSLLVIRGVRENFVDPVFIPLQKLIKKLANKQIGFGFNHVRAHKGNFYNEKVDSSCRSILRKHVKMLSV